MTATALRTRPCGWRPSTGRPSSRDPRREKRGSDLGWDGALVAATCLRLLPRVRQDAHAPAEHEQAAGQRCREAELAIDDRCAAVDVHRYGLAARSLQGALDRVRRGQEVAP